jgi:hypothetical protein
MNKLLLLSLNEKSFIAKNKNIFSNDFKDKRKRTLKTTFSAKYSI